MTGDLAPASRASIGKRKEGRSVMDTANQLGSVEHIVVLMLENRSFDHMLRFLYADSGNVSPVTKQAFEGLTGKESNEDATGTSIPVSALTQGSANLYFTPGADRGEGFLATN